jgi:MraZ protein
MWRNVEEFELYLQRKKRPVSRTNFNGEFECRIDEKGRLIFPSRLKKQLSPLAEGKFYINRGFEKCLVLYPLNEWDLIRSQLQRLNLYVKKNRKFVRYFYRGATELALDSQNRLLLPKTLFSYAGINKDVILCAYSDRIEIWDKPSYEKMMTEEPDDFADLAEEVMGDMESPDIPDDVS